MSLPGLRSLVTPPSDGFSASPRVPITLMQEMLVPFQPPYKEVRFAMPTIVMSLPIAPGQTEAFRTAHQRFAVQRRSEFEASRRRLGVHIERGFLQRTSAGDFAIVIFEVDDPARMFAGVASSDDPLD